MCPLKSSFTHLKYCEISGSFDIFFESSDRIDDRLFLGGAMLNSFNSFVVNYFDNTWNWCGPYNKFGILRQIRIFLLKGVGEWWSLWILARLSPLYLSKRNKIHTDKDEPKEKCRWGVGIDIFLGAAQSHCLLSIRNHDHNPQQNGFRSRFRRMGGRDTRKSRLPKAPLEQNFNTRGDLTCRNGRIFNAGFLHQQKNINFS